MIGMNYYKDLKFYGSLMLFIYFTLPALDPVTFQRILMAKHTNQVRNSFIYSALICLFMGVMACFIGIISLAHNPNMDPSNLIIYVIDNYSFVGLKGLVLIGIMAMGMSSADSYINASAIIFSNDFCNPLGIKIIQNELLLARICSCIIGGIAIFLVLFGFRVYGAITGFIFGMFFSVIFVFPYIKEIIMLLLEKNPEKRPNSLELL
jgi:Na+/proline symporter